MNTKRFSHLYFSFQEGRLIFQEEPGGPERFQQAEEAEIDTAVAVQKATEAAELGIDETDAEAVREELLAQIEGDLQETDVFEQMRDMLIDSTSPKEVEIRLWLAVLAIYKGREREQNRKAQINFFDLLQIVRADPMFNEALDQAIEIFVEVNGRKPLSLQERQQVLIAVLRSIFGDLTEEETESEQE